MADAAAVSAAGAIDTRAYYASGGSEIVLDESAAEIAAAELIQERGLTEDVEFVADDGHVAIVARGRVSTTFLRLVGIKNISVAASASAVAFPQLVPAAP